MTTELLLIPDAPVSAMVQRVKIAERSGYDTVWLADERFYREVYSCLSVLATVTERVRLGPCVTDPFARHPALTAMAIATLDEISGGRAILGLGAGASGFAELGIERKKPPRAMRETIELVRALLTGEEVDFHGEVVHFNSGHLGFKPGRADIPFVIASNGPLGQRLAGSTCSGAIMEACASVAEARVFRAEVARGAEKAGRDPGEVRLTARLNCCLAADGAAARDAVRPTVARMLARGTMVFATAEAEGLLLPPEIKALAPKDAPYAAGVRPYLPLVPHVTDRQVDALTLAGTVDEAVEHLVALREAGIDNVIIRPFAPEGGTIEDTISIFGTRVMPAVERASAR